MKNKLLFVLFGLLIFSVSNAQKYDLGKVSIEELSQKSHPSDPEAPAAILYKKGKSYFDVDGNGYFVLVTEIEQRIKIYKKEGYEYGNQEIPYYVGGVRDVKVTFDEACTYNLVNGKIEKTKLKSDSEFKETINESFRSKKIALPNIKEGSVIEFKYTIRSPYYSSFPDWYFEYVIPADYVEYTVCIAEFFSYNRVLTGYLNVEQSKMASKISLNRRFGEGQITYKVKDVKAYKEETHVDNMRNYISVLEHELAETSFPNASKEKFSTDWESVAKTIYDDDKFGRELNFNSYYEEELGPFLKEGASEEEKFNSVFDFLKKKITWDKTSTYYCKKGVKQAFKDKVGNAAEINLMLVSMLRYAGLKANPVLISTRNNGIAKFPSRNGFNYVIAGVETKKGLVLLDATSKSAMPNILPIRALNRTGRLIREDKTSREVNLDPKSNSKEINTVFAEMTPDGKLKGKVRSQYFDYNAFLFRENNSGVSKESSASRIEKKLQGIEIDDFKVVNIDDLEKPVFEEFSFTHDGVSEIIGEKIYFSPMLFYVSLENPFKQEKRQYPVDFKFPYQDRFMFTIKIPEGYEVETLPKPLMLSMEKDIGSFSYNISQAQNQIQVATAFDINFANVSADYYQTLKDFFKAFIEKQNEKIILKKV